MGEISLFLADTSAWHRSQHPDVLALWAQRLREDVLATCSQVRLEILCCARNLESYEQLAEELRALHELPCGSAQFKRALELQHELAAQGGLHHRAVKIPDLLIAASAEATGATVWHYDEDYDRVAAITGQATEWIAPRGSL